MGWGGVGWGGGLPTKVNGLTSCGKIKRQARFLIALMSSWMNFQHELEANQQQVNQQKLLLFCQKEIFEKN